MSVQPEIDSMAPDFSLPTTGGEVLTLSALRGRPVVIYFYPKDDTSGCTREAIDFSALADAFAALSVTVIGISPDSVKSHEKFAGKHDLKVRLGADPEKSVLAAYGVWVEKSMYGRSYMGVERTTFLIDAGGRIARIWKKVKVTGHAGAVLDAARALAG